MKKLLTSFLLVCATFSSYARVANPSPLTDGDGNSSTTALNPVIQWNKTLLVIVRTPGAQPATMHSTRSFAIMHAAIYDAVNAIDQGHKPYLVTLPDVPPSASQEAAAAAAAHEVLVALGCTISRLQGFSRCCTSAIIGPDCG